MIEDLFSSEEEAASVMKAYFDESGKHGPAPVITIAGLLTSKGACNELQRRWIVEAAREPKIPLPFSMSDCVCGSKLFKLWKDDETTRLQMQERMIKTFRGLDLHAYGASVIRSEYRPVVTDLRRSEAFRDPWFLAFESSVQEVMIQSGNIGKTHPISLVFDRQDEFETDAHILYNGILALKDCSYRPRLGSLIFSPKDQVAALQAADIIVYEVCRYITNCKLGQDAPRWQINLIREYVTVNCALWDAPGLRWLRECVLAPS